MYYQGEKGGWGKLLQIFKSLTPTQQVDVSAEHPEPQPPHPKPPATREITDSEHSLRHQRLK